MDTGQRIGEYWILLLWSQAHFMHEGPELLRIRRRVPRGSKTPTGSESQASYAQCHVICTNVPASYALGLRIISIFESKK